MEFSARSLYAQESRALEWKALQSGDHHSRAFESTAQEFRAALSTDLESRPLESNAQQSMSWSGSLVQGPSV